MAFWTCGCGAVNKARDLKCEICDEKKGAGADAPETASAALNVCERCRSVSPSTTAFHEDGALEDRGKRLCPGCWVLALKRRAALDPITGEARAGWRALVYNGVLPVEPF